MTLPATRDEKGSNRPTTRYIVIALAMVVFGLMLQLQCRFFETVIDDNDLIYSAEQRGCGANPADCFRHPVFMLYYRPLFTATFAVGDHLHSRDAIWYHLENLALHAAVCGLGFWFFHLLFRRERPALLAGLVFTLHPLQVSVTSFIGGRPDSMALFFLLLFSIGAWNTAPKSRPAPLHPPRLGWLLLSVLSYACAVFTKEQCISLLLVLPLLLWRPGYAYPRKYLPLLSLYLAPVLLYIAAAKQIIPFATIPQPHWGMPLHLEMIGRTLFYFQRLFVLPTVGQIHRSTLGSWDVPQFGVAISGFLVTALWLGMLWRVRHNPALRFCALWTTLTLLPCINLIPIPSQFASCYRAVIPLLGFAGLLGAGLDAFLNWSQKIKTLDPFKIGWALALSVGVYYSWETAADVRTWQNLRTLMQAEIEGDPNFVPAYGGLGMWDDSVRDWKSAERDYSAVLARTLPIDQSGQSFAEAVDSAACQRTLWSQSGLRYHPRLYFASMLPHRGWARQQQGHFTAAAEDYRLALLLNPRDDNSRANLRNCYMANGRIDDALSLYRRASDMPPRRASDVSDTGQRTR